MATIKHFARASMKCLTESNATLRDGTLADMMQAASDMTEGDTPLRTDYRNGYILFNYQAEGLDVVVTCTPEEEINMLS